MSIIAMALQACCLLSEGSLGFCQTSEKTSAQVAPGEKIDSYVTQEMRARRIPALALFRAEEAERRAHAVQYVSHPKYTWPVLRQDKPGQYEKPIVPVPDGDAWFHVRIVVEKPKVRVYVNDGKESSLVVDELTDRKGGGVGLWVGPGQGGYLANLKITPAKESDREWGRDSRVLVSVSEEAITL
jgi:hypothetical protein